MQDFVVSFLANLLSDALLAVAVYLIVTQPGERRRRRVAITKSLGLLKAEAQVNFNRARAYGQALTDPSEDIAALFPLRYSRGAWNALKETGFSADLDDAHLKYFLFRMNEATFVANKNLRKLQLAYLEDKQSQLDRFIGIAQDETRHVLEVLDKVLHMLHGVEIPEFAVEDPFERSPILPPEEDEA